MAHAPRGFVCHARLALDLLGRNAMAGRCHQVHRKEPVRQLSAGFVKDRISTGVDLMAAVLTGECLALAHQVEFRLALAGRANNVRSAVLRLHQLEETGIIGRVLGLKCFETVRRLLCHGWFPLAVVG